MTANDTQVGGAHYRSAYQHWDLCLALGWGVLEVYITKYALRHKDKNGRQDLEKAVHCAQKMEDHARRSVWPGSPSETKSLAVYEVRRFVAANGIEPGSTLAELFMTCARWRGERGAADVLTLTQRLLREWDLEHALDNTHGQVELNLDGGSSAPD